jgi:UDP-2-acetamido-3-amino-2,3-dideoxy-glucuronate N-acetyltransferase
MIPSQPQPSHQSQPRPEPQPAAKQHVAVIGTGYWGKNLVRTFANLGVLHIVCDASRDCLDRLQVDSAVQRTDNYPEVLKDPQVSAIAIATPASSHFDLVRSALQAGKDVFVEKPLALAVQEGQELVKLAADAKRILMVGHILRHHPAVRKLKDMVDAGELGKVEYIYSNRLSIGKLRTEENILWSFAPHDVSVMIGLLGEMPAAVSCQGGDYLSRGVCDVTVSQFTFSSGVRAHVFVSWLHPFKEQRLVVVGSEKMAVFDDTAKDKLVTYPHKVEWKNRVPTAVKAAVEVVPIEATEPLKAECLAFLESLETRRPPLTDGHEGLRVLEVLDACQRSLSNDGVRIMIDPQNTQIPEDSLRGPQKVKTNQRESVKSAQSADNASSPHPSSTLTSTSSSFFVHETARVDDGAVIGAGTKVWHFSHVIKGAKIGERCILGQNVNVDGGAVIGNNVKIQNNVSVYTGVIIEDDVFLGPSCVLTNVSNPRSEINRHALYEQTVLMRGCTIGANATIVCGTTIGRYAFVAAGSVVTQDVPDYALVMGNPARRTGWMSRHGQKLGTPDAQGIMVCPESGQRYQEEFPGILQSLDLDEEVPLPSELSKGTKPYREFRRSTPTSTSTSRRPPRTRGIRDKKTKEETT